MNAHYVPLPDWPGTFERPSGAWRWLCPSKPHGFLLFPSYSLAYVEFGTAAGSSS